jgi:hypothetical protein
MADEASASSGTTANSNSSTAAAPTQPGPTINIAAEFGTAKRNLPPIKVLLLALAGVLALAAIVAFFQRARPQASGILVNANAAQIPSQNAILVALTLTLRNPGEKSLWVKNIRAELMTTEGEQTGEALSAIDFDRYYQAFPQLRRNSQPALAPEDKLRPGQEITRTVIFSFPVALDNFNKRRSIRVIIQPYDQPLPVVLVE